MEIELVGELTEEQRQKLLAIAANCPVHRTLKGELAIETRLQEPPGR
jgi:putative redox protein